MVLRDQMHQQGDWLFRRRSYLPLAIVPLLALALGQADSLEARGGSLLDHGWKVFCLVISVAGLVVRGLVVAHAPAGTSGRGTAKQRADSLNTTGLYSVVRHPLYLGNFLAAMGVAMFLEVWWFAIICALGFWLYYERIMLAEEAFLEAKFGDDFRAWAAATPVFVPRLRGWRRPTLGFSVRNVLRREYTGFALLIASFCAADVLADGVTRRDWQPDASLAAALTVAGLVYITLLTLKKTTRLLEVQGR